MKNLKTQIMAVGTLCMMFTSSCTKDDTGDPIDNTPDVLCDGSSSTSWYPLVTGNSWAYKASNANGTDQTGTVTGNQDFGSETYFEIKYLDEIGFDWYEYYREDASGNIYVYYEGQGEEIIFAPANPVVGTVYAISDLSETFNYNNKVAGLNETTSTPSCTYSGCLHIQRVNHAGEVYKDFYIKKGLGIVKVSVHGFLFHDDELSTVTLN